MKALSLVSLAALALLGCAAPAPTVQTVTVTKTVPVFPPSVLYSQDGKCNHAPTITQGTVLDLANALIDERAALAVCLGDRAALRAWRSEVK